MSLTLSRIDRVNHTIDVAKLFPGLTVTGLSVALLPTRSEPTAATVWTSITYSAGTGTFLAVGPDADSTAAIVVPATADLWARATDGTQVDAAFVERITVKDSSGTVLPDTPDAYIAALLNNTNSATYARVVALITARTGFGAGA